MITKLTRKDNPEVFEIFELPDYYFIVDECPECKDQTYSDYTFWYIELTEKEFPNNPEYHGFWMTNDFYWSNFNMDDCDQRDIKELYRVKKVKKVIETEEWKLVENV